ncbi:TrmB family transcriptional regulator [Methanobrevibacter sp. DSM 116169]|uniref:TrmB family transcriptional regulator n=1 Tax=Methanobrevibacter sp. DSM 116169 TaxID=3242727 RepID=UPI0038FD1B2C
MENKNIEVLKKLGLTTNEATVYITLNSLISGKATEISEHSKIPRSKVYDVLKSLYVKNFIEIERTKPIKYTVIPPRDTFKKEKDKLISELNETERDLNEIYEDQISYVQAPMWLIHGQDKIIKKEIEIISRAKSSVNLRIGFLFENELEKLIDVFKKKNKIQINILYSPNCYIENKKIDIANKIDLDNVNMKKFDLPPVKVIIRDGQELIQIYSKFLNKKTVIPNTSIGVWNQYEEIAKNYNERFNKQFNKNK